MKKRRFKSLSVSLPIQLALCTVVLMAVVSVFVYVRYHLHMMDEYTEKSAEISGMIAAEVSGDRVEAFLRGDAGDGERQEMEHGLLALKRLDGDLLWACLARADADGTITVFLPEPDEAENAGIAEAFASGTGGLLTGEELPGQIVRTKSNGSVYARAKPVFREDGTYACSVCVVYSLDHLNGLRGRYLLQMAMAVVIVAGVILAVEILLIRRRVTDPIRRLSRCAEQFSYASEEDRMNNIDLLKQADIRSGDEIEDVYRAFMSVTRDSFISSTGLNSALLDIRDKEEEITAISEEAYTDRLTGFRSASAFRREVENINREIREGKAEFALIMYDVNNLKYINDTFGHHYGHQYIRGCSRVIRERCPDAGNFRTGGDEFVSVLRGGEYADREGILRDIRAAFEALGSDTAKDPWERYSASVGMSVFRVGDESFRPVFNRADEEMYADKEAYHQKAGRYR